MKKDDLTQVKHIGTARMNILLEAGIKSLKKLYETPTEKLTQIQGIGKRSAGLIKDSVTEIYEEGLQKSVTQKETGKELKTKKLDQQLQKQIQTVKKRLKQSIEKLKPLHKKKYLAPYIDFKRKVQRLRERLSDLEKVQGQLSKKDKKKIIKNASDLSAILKTEGKKPKIKNYKKVIREVQFFSKTIK